MAPEDKMSAGGRFDKFAECTKVIGNSESAFEEFREPIARWRVLSAKVADGGKSATVEVSGGKPQRLKWEEDRIFKIDFEK